MASKMYAYLVIGMGMMLLFRAAGIETGVDSILSYFCGNANFLDQSFVCNFSLSSFFATAASALGLAAGVGIALGSILNRDVATTVTLSIGVAILAIFTPVYVNIFNNLSAWGGWVGTLSALVFIPFIVSFVITVIQFIKGSD